MKIIDIFNLSNLYNKRSKNRYYFIVMLICSIIFTLTIIINNNVFDIVDKGIARNIGFRTIVVTLPNERQNIEKKIKNINHIVDFFDGDYTYTSVVLDSLDGKPFNGYLTLKRFNNATMPKIRRGTLIDDNLEGVIICPDLFYPYTLKNFNKEKILKEEDILNKIITIKYHNHKYVNNQYIADSVYYKKLKISSLYNSNDNFDDNGTCYINYKELEEIVNNMRNNINDNKYEGVSIDYSYNVVVDSLVNVDYVKSELSNLGFEVMGVNASVDEEFISIFKISISGIIIIILSAITILNYLYIKKRILKDEFDVGVYKSLGYENKNVLLIYATQIFINHFIVYLLSGFLSLIIYLVIKYNYSEIIAIDLLAGGLKIEWYIWLLSFLFVVIIPVFISMIIVLTKTSIHVKRLFQNGE